MKKRDADQVIREALMKRLRVDDSAVPVVTRQPLAGGKETLRLRVDGSAVPVVTRQPLAGGKKTLRLSNGIAIRLVWTVTGRTAHRFDFTCAREPILYVEVPSDVASLGELLPHFEALVPAFVTELAAHAGHDHLTIAGHDHLTIAGHDHLTIARHDHLTIVGGGREHRWAGRRQRFIRLVKSAAIVVLFVLIIRALIRALWALLGDPSTSVG